MRDQGAQRKLPSSSISHGPEPTLQENSLIGTLGRLSVDGSDSDCVLVVKWVPRVNVHNMGTDVEASTHVRHTGAPLVYRENACTLRSQYFQYIRRKRSNEVHFEVIV